MQQKPEQTSKDTLTKTAEQKHDDEPMETQNSKRAVKVKRLVGVLPKEVEEEEKQAVY